MRKDPKTGNIDIVWTDRWALKDAHGQTCFLEIAAVEKTRTVTPEQYNTQVPYVDLATGAHLGQTVSFAQIMAGDIAGVRYFQELEDAEAQALVDAAAAQAQAQADAQAEAEVVRLAAEAAQIDAPPAL